MAPPDCTAQRRAALLDRDALGEVPGLVHVAAEAHRHVVREDAAESGSGASRSAQGGTSITCCAFAATPRSPAWTTAMI